MTSIRSPRFLGLRAVDVSLVAVVLVLAAGMVGNSLWTARTLAGLETERLAYLKPPPLPEFAIGPRDLRVLDGRLAVAVAARFFDRDPSGGYLWSVRVVGTPDGVVRFTSRNDDWPRRSSTGWVQSMSFAEILDVDLKPGDYRVEIAVLRIPDGQAASALNDPEIASRAVVCHDSATITVEATSRQVHEGRRP